MLPIGYTGTNSSPASLTVTLPEPHTLCVTAGHEELLLTNESWPSRPSIHLGGVFVCARVHYCYSVPRQVINVWCSNCFGHCGRGLPGIP